MKLLKESLNIMTFNKIERAKALRAEGKTYKEIASIIGCSRETVRKNILTEKRTVEDTKALTKAEEADVIKRTKSGESQASIARSYNISDSTVRNILKRNGVWEKRSIAKTQQEIDLRNKYIDNAIRKLQTNRPISEQKKICKEYQEGMPQKALIKKYKIHAQVLKEFLLRNGIKLRTQAEAIGSIPEIEHSKIVSRYKNGEGSTRIAEIYNCDAKQITSILDKYNIPLRRTQILVRLYPHYKTILKRYKDGEALTQIAKDFNVSSSPIKRILISQGVRIKSSEETQRVLPLEARNNICRLYREGKSYREIANDYGCSSCAIIRVLKLGKVKARSISESRWPNNGIAADLEVEVCERYKSGESTKNLERYYQVEQSSIFRLLKRRGYEIRSQGNLGDSVQHALNATSNFKSKEETSFYIFDLHKYPGYLKPGITNSIKDRSSKRWYKDLLFEQILPSRTGAYFLEQVILDATRDSWDCPKEIQKDYKWGGRDEVRLMNIDELIAISEYYYDEYCELGLWEFAAEYLPKNITTSIQREECRKRAKEI